MPTYRGQLLIPVEFELNAANEHLAREALRKAAEITRDTHPLTDPTMPILRWVHPLTPASETTPDDQLPQPA